MRKPPVYEGDQPYIFISYSHTDSQRALQVISWLTDAGYRVWYDEGLVVGTEYDDLIAEHIEKCSVFICLLTKEYGGSAFCKWELNYAIESLKKVCVPIYLDEMDGVKRSLPGGLRMKLSTVHAIVKVDERKSFFQEMERSRSVYACLGEREEIDHPVEENDDLKKNADAFYDNRKYEECLPLYLKLAECGDAFGQNRLADMYDRGLGVPRDYEEAAKWYRFAAEQGVAEAQYNLGYLYYTGMLETSEDYQEAAKWFRLAAEKGHSLGQFYIGIMHALGKGVPKDYKEALKWYKKAAEQGLSAAQYNLGGCYECGNGVPRDYEEALKWYKMAVEGGEEYAKKRIQAVQEKLNRGI